LLTWDEFRISYRCVKCDAGDLTNVACVNEGVVSDGVVGDGVVSDDVVSDGVVSDGGGGVAVGDDNAVAGGSGDGDDVEAIRARSESRPKRAVKRREILDPSYVSKR
jgi:hypothetical protein